jgi:hypothetical protein
MHQVSTPNARCGPHAVRFGFDPVPPCRALRIDVGDFARPQGNHDRKANLHYKEYVIYPGQSRLLLSLSRRDDDILQGA